jgi:hypothetical protein
MKLLKITSLFFLIFISLKGNAQTNFEWTKRSPYFTNGTATLVSYIDLGEIRYWGFIEISLTDSYSNANTTGLYKKVYNIGTNAVNFSSNTSEVVSAIGSVSGHWKLGEFLRDANDHLIVPIYHLTSTGNAITVNIKGITLTPINTEIFAITIPEVIANTQTRDYNYIKGKLSLGTANADTDALLTVAGNINARELKVKVDAGADFVFAKDYQLPELESVESFVKTNGHLQDIQSAKEMKSKGLQVGNFQIKLLQKIEELTLYLIEQNKKINDLQSEIKKINSRL